MTIIGTNMVECARRLMQGTHTHHDAKTCSSMCGSGVCGRTGDFFGLFVGDWRRSASEGYSNRCDYGKGTKHTAGYWLVLVRRDRCGLLITVDLQVHGESGAAAPRK